MKVIKWLDQHFEETLMVILLVMICCVELIQVVVRNLEFVSALTWAEEFCRFCWIWSVFISLPYTIRKGNMLRVSVVLDLFPEKVRAIINIAVEVVITLSMLLLGVNSVEVVSGIMASGESSSAMLWPMWIVYSVMLLGFFLGAVRGGQQVYLHVKHFGEHQLSTKEQAMAEAAEEAKAGRIAEGGEV